MVIIECIEYLLQYSKFNCYKTAFPTSSWKIIENNRIPFKLTSNPMYHTIEMNRNIIKKLRNWNSSKLFHILRTQILIQAKLLTTHQKLLIIMHKFSRTKSNLVMRSNRDPQRALKANWRGLNIPLATNFFNGVGLTFDWI